MTVREVMQRLAGDDYEWSDVDGDLMGMGDVEVQGATLVGQEGGRTIVFRVPVERLVKKGR